MSELQKINEDMVQEESILPPGLIAPFAMLNAPEGWLVCDGSTVDSVANVSLARLYSAIGTTWGGTSASDFKLPDLRGEFLRGLDGGRSVDAGRTIGSSQDHGIPKLEGSVHSEWNAMYHSSGIFKKVDGSNLYGSNGGGGGRGFEFSSTDVIPDAPEVRPRNVAVLYCIKY